MSCCWICTACKENEYVQDEFTCKACELGWWPDEELEGGFPPPCRFCVGSPQSRDQRQVLLDPSQRRAGTAMRFHLSGAAALKGLEFMLTLWRSEPAAVDPGLPGEAPPPRFHRDVELAVQALLLAEAAQGALPAAAPPKPVPSHFHCFPMTPESTFIILAVSRHSCPTSLCWPTFRGLVVQT